MFRKYVILTLATFFLLGSAACTSKKAQDTGSADVQATSSDGDAIDNADAVQNNDDLSMDSADDQAVADMGGDDLAPDEQGATAQDDAASTDAAPSDLDQAPPPADGSAAAPT